jgi:hypothetical protein
MLDSIASLLNVPRLLALLQRRSRPARPLGPSNPAHIRVVSHETATHHSEVRNAKWFDQDELRVIQCERVGQVYTGRVMTGDWDNDAYVRRKERSEHPADQSIRPWELKELQGCLPRTGNDFIDGHHVPRIFTNIPGVFLIGARPDIRQHPSVPFIVAVSAEGRRCTHVNRPAYTIVHIDQLPPDVTGIAASDEIFFGDGRGFCTGVVQEAWLLTTGHHILLRVQGRSVDWMLRQYSPHWCVVISACMYVRVLERGYCQLRVLVQQDIDLRHSSCFEDLTEAITMHVV